MPVVNSGSLALNIFNSIAPLSSNISGLLVTIVDQNRYFVENLTGDSIGNSIAEQYQLPISDMATSQVLKLMAVQDTGVKTVTIGDLSTDNANLMEMAKQFEQKAMFEIKSLQKGVRYYKARG